MPPRTWKNIEAKVAKMVGAQRVGARGDTSFDVVGGPDWDVDGCPLGIEVKYRHTVPGYLKSYLQQAEQHREKTLPNADPVVVLVENGMRRKDFMCLLRFEDYLRLRKWEAQQRTGDEVV